MTRQDLISKRFSRLAAFYDLAAAVGSFGAIRRAQLTFLPQITESANKNLKAATKSQHILIIGGGTGQLLEAFSAAPATLKISFLEPAAGMLSRARRRAQKLNLNVEFIATPLESTQLPGNVDVICTPFVLDLFTTAQAREQMRRLSACLPAGGIWVEADFRTVDQGVLHWPVRLYLSGLYWFFGLACGIEARELPRTAEIFGSMDYHLQACRTFLGGVIETRVYRKGRKC